MATKHKNIFSRRKAIQLGISSIAGTQLSSMGLPFLGSVLPKHEMFDRFRMALMTGNSEALAATLAPPPVNIVICHFMDKLCEHGVFPYAEALATQNGYDGAGQSYRGIDLAGSLSTESNLRGFGFNQCFSQGLIAGGLPAGYNIVAIPCRKDGNHTLADQRISPEVGSLVYASVATGQAGPLGHIGFKVDGNATDGSEGMQAPGGVPMDSYASVRQVRDLLKKSVASLPDPNSKSGLFRNSLDQLALIDSKSQEILNDVRTAAAPAVESLLSAMTNPDPLDSQIDSIVALQKTGLASVFTIGIGTADMNGGGSFAQAGGDTVIQGYDLSATAAHAAAGYAIGRVGKEMGSNTFFMFGSDGGRGSTGGDSGEWVNFICGPNLLLNDCGKGNKRQFSRLGNNDPQLSLIKMSDGSTVNRCSPAQLQALVMKLAYNVDFSGVAYPIEIGGIKISPKFT